MIKLKRSVLILIISLIPATYSYGQMQSPQQNVNTSAVGTMAEPWKVPGK